MCAHSSHTGKIEAAAAFMIAADPGRPPITIFCVSNILLIINRIDS
jgi:hypothetical protein